MILSTKLKLKFYNTYFNLSRPYQKFNVVFIVSTGRTGTNFFQNFLNEIGQECLVYHEPRPTFFHLGINKFRQNLVTRNVVQEIISKRRKIFKECLWKNKNIYVESNPYAALLVPEIKAAFPEAKFVFISREPLSYVKSIINKKNTFLDGHTYFAYGPNDRGDRLNPSDFSDDKWLNQWDDFSRYEKVSWYWQKVNKLIMDDLESIPKSDQIHVKFEELFSDSKQMEKTAQFILGKSNLETSQIQSLLKKKANKSNSNVFDSSEFEKDKASIMKIVSEVSKTLNYSD